jgi:hypothetical protein
MIGSETRATMTIRVWVPEVWDHVELPVTPDLTVSQLKADALKRATGGSRDPAAYVVKYRGALLTDESQTVGELAVPDHAPMIILSARRRPVL